MYVRLNKVVPKKQKMHQGLTSFCKAGKVMEKKNLNNFQFSKFRGLLVRKVKTCWRKLRTSVVPFCPKKNFQKDCKIRADEKERNGYSQNEMNFDRKDLKWKHFRAKKFQAKIIQQ